MMAASAKVQSQIESCDVKKKNNGSSKGISSNLIDNQTRHSSSFKNQSKRTEVSLNLSQELDATERQALTSPVRLTWKSSKLFSQTLSSIEMNKGAKANKQPYLSSKSETACTVHCFNEDGSSSGSRNTDKRETNLVRTSSETPKSSKAVSEWKTLKNKLIFLRKKGDFSSELTGHTNVTGQSGFVKDSGHQKFKQIANQMISKQRGKKSKPQMEGIVCKKEDLIHLLAKASKNQSRPPSNSPGILVNSLSTRDTQNAKQLNIDEEGGGKAKFGMKSVLKKNYSTESNNKTESSSNRSVDENLSNNLNQCKISFEDRVQIIEEGNGQNVNTQNVTHEEGQLGNKNKQTEALEGDNGYQERRQKKNGSELNETLSSNNSASVKWDESNVIDTMILGDAIQAFLKEMRATSNEKKVTFKRNS